MTDLVEHDVIDMLIFLLFGVLCIQGETEGQNCTFPCSWHNKDFKLMIGNNIPIGFWNFSETTFIQQTAFFGTSNMECFKIFGRFLIVSNPFELICFAIEITNGVSFTALLGNAQSDVDECSICSAPTNTLFKLSVVDNVAQDQTGPECNIPVGCTPSVFAKNPIICEDNGNIEEGNCNEPTTSPPPPPRKHCKHRDP